MNSQTILIVEDDQPTRELYQRELGACYNVLACANQEAALAAIRSHQLSAIILEPSLPDGGGWELLSSIRSMPNLQTVPIILCSTLNARRKAISLGATLYLVKPVLPAMLLEAVRQAITIV